MVFLPSTKRRSGVDASADLHHGSIFVWRHSIVLHVTLSLFLGMG